MNDESWQAFIQVAGVINATLLGAVLLLSPRLRRTRARRKLGLAFLAYGYLLFSFTAVDNYWMPSVWWVWLLDYIVVLLASTLFLDYMSGALGRGDIPRYFYATPFLFALAAMALGTDFIDRLAINVVIALQFVYSAITTWLFIRHGRTLVSRPRHLFVLLAGLWTLHAFQLSRMLFPGVGWLFDLVPLVGAVLMITLTTLVLLDSRTMRQFSEVAADPAPAAMTAEKLEEYMNAEKPYLDPQLTLDQLAAALGLPRRELSKMLGATTGGSFYNYVNNFRVQEALRLLDSPREKRTSIEAIGLMAGFRARSTFYEAFRRDNGMTPAQYRERAQS